MSSVLTVPAAPAELSLDPARTAVIVVDMQNDFGSPGGMFEAAGIDISAIRATIPPTRAVLEAARAAGMTVVYLRMAMRPDLSDSGGTESPHWIKHRPLRAGEASVAPDGREGRVLVDGTWNTEIVPELPPGPDDLIVRKHRYSGFFGTDLHDLLQARGIGTLVFTGCTTSVCVESTLRDAMFRDYRCLLLEDCCAEPVGSGTARSNHEATLDVVRLLFGWTAPSSALLGALARATAA